ncbi:MULTISPECIES: CvpA family protein [unclassified Devosia]|uniref:CvpA family protein n=1 Tax=unclassified Devosia TaxID=196773 RepID=UPI00145F4583|nr:MULTISPECIES: CvpA family protein [unclassified Devosia]MBJ6988827.1 CvpA family protein [Devosia sp. MC521]MBJ7578193.1 CvpA family protein [Devosia sp. MC532]QMW63640.1 CvpA family protein [Devosia sp. MC521]
MLTAFDVGVGVLVLISAILATARGLTREVLSLATWAGSAAIAVYMWQYHPEIARGYIAEPVVADIATVVLSFIISLIVLHLLTMRIADFVIDSRIGPIDRTLGFVFGVLRGILISIVITIFGVWLLGTNLPEWADKAQTRPHLQNMGTTLISMLPDGLEAQVTDILRGGGGNLTDDTEAPVALPPEAVGNGTVAPAPAASPSITTLPATPQN